MRLPEPKKLVVPLFFIAVFAGILYAGFRVVGIQNAWAHLGDAPQGQSAGPADAEIVIAEFMDYRCKGCRRLYPVMKAVAERHPEVKIVYHHRSVTGMTGLREAEIALAAGMQGKFTEMNDVLMARDEPVQTKEIEQLCTKVGVDCVKLLSDMKNPELLRSLQNSESTARALGITRDPAIVIGRHIYTTRYGMPTQADFDRLIAQAQPAKKG